MARASNAAQWPLSPSAGTPSKPAARAVVDEGGHVVERDVSRLWLWPEVSWLRPWARQPSPARIFPSFLTSMCTCSPGRSRQYRFAVALEAPDQPGRRSSPAGPAADAVAGQHPRHLPCRNAQFGTDPVRIPTLPGISGPARSSRTCGSSPSLSDVRLRPAGLTLLTISS